MGPGSLIIRLFLKWQSLIAISVVQVCSIAEVSNMADINDGLMMVV